MKYLLNKNMYVLYFSLFICGTFSLLVGKDLCWDLANYHYYIPYALLHNRYAIDVWPTSFFHQYLNPTADLLNYFLINHLATAYAVFTLGAIHGLNLWLLFLINKIFFEDAFIIPLGLALLGMYAPDTLPNIGTVQNDLTISIFILSYLFLQLKILKTYSTTKLLDIKQLALAGILLGIGIGLKLTAGLFLIGGLAATTFAPIKINNKLKMLFVLSIATFIGLLLSSGFWMWNSWQQHANPVFPFLNNLFHSPDFVATNWRDTRFLPKNLLQTLFYPFYFSWDGRTSDDKFRDFRFLLVYVLLILNLAKLIIFKTKNQPIFSKKALPSHWLTIFFIASYIAWEYYFSIARYIIILEMLAPLLIYILISKVIETKWIKLIVISLVFYFLSFLMIPTYMVRLPWYNTSYLNVKLPTSVSKTSSTVVLMALPAYAYDSHPSPQTYLIPFFPPQWKFIGIPFFHKEYLTDTKIIDAIQHSISHNGDTIYLLTTEKMMPKLKRAMQPLGLHSTTECEKIFSDRQYVSQQNTLLCPVKYVNS